MVMRERIIKFPVPAWNEIVNLESTSKAYCLCYQYDVGVNDFGPYGFNTEASYKIISEVFNNLRYCHIGSKVELSHMENIKRKGLYLYGDIEKIKKLEMEINKYYIAKKKNELKIKKALCPELLPSEPLLLRMLRNDVFEEKDIKEVLNLGCGLFISEYYSPEAGNSIILFEESVMDLLKDCMKKYGVFFLEVNSIDELKAW